MEALFLFVLAVSAFFLLGKKEKKRGQKKRSENSKKGANSLAASIIIVPEKKLFKKAEKPLNDLIASYLPNRSKIVIIAVRKKVFSHVSAGLRPESLSKALAKEFDIPAELAAIIARHGSGFLLSKYHQYRAMEVGICRYKWAHGHSGRNGCQHAFLDGQIFEFSNPPIIDDAGNRANPGEAYPCVCTAISIIE